MQLMVAFSIIDKHEGRQVYSNVSKLRMLIKKIKADFLEIVRNGIKLDMTRIPMTMTYDIALSNYRNAVNRKFPDGERKKTRRNIRKTNTGRGRDGGRGQGGGGGRGRGSFQQNK